MESLHPDSNLKHFAYCINKALFNETIVGQQSLVSPGSWTQMLTIQFLKKLNICNELGSSSSNLISMSNIYDIMSSLFVKSILFCVTEFNLFEYFCIYEYAKVFLWCILVIQILRLWISQIGSHIVNSFFLDSNSNLTSTSTSHRVHLNAQG